MVTTTPILAEAARLLTSVFTDTVQVHNVGEPVTVGIHVTRELTPVGEPIPALVQTTTLENAIESRVESLYSVKVAQGTVISAGQAIEVITCQQEPDLVGKTLLLDKVSQNGAAIIRKAVATDFKNINQEGKEGIS
ncbi:hypothetical protein SEA_THERESITA_10 [Microbacterium phage Theresita]|nr:hypothetical protein SEA_THERESITA_10 [Microbacterium phage Theresita]